jgi:multidrug efflux pump subunit AcrB
MLTAIVVMSFLNVELQRMSIAAMIISLGMLVDNGIVMVESITVKMAAGMNKKTAAISAGKTLAIPLLTSTLTTILFFIPIAMAEGGVGEYTMSLAQVITIVLLISWFFSLYITPIVSAKFLVKESSNKQQGKLVQVYTSLLHQILHFKVLFITFMIVLLIGSGYLLSTVGKEFFPLGDRNQFLVYIDLPAGTSITKTDEVIQRMSRWLSDKTINPEILSSVSYVASGGPRFFLSLSPPDPDPHKAFTVVNTQSSEQVDAVIHRVQSHLLDQFPEVQGEVKKMWMGASEAGLFELRVLATDQQTLFDQSETITQALRAIPNMTSVKHDWENKIIKLDINIDQARARNVDISSEQIANALNSYFSGSAVTDYREGEHIIPIIVRGLEDERDTLADIAKLNVYSKTLGKTIPLTQIVDVTGGWQVARIKRRNQQRTLTISAKNRDLTALQILEQIQPTLDTMSGDFELQISGEIEEQSKANGKLFANFPYAIGLIILLLIWQFNSYRKTAIILLTIPLVLIGATLGLVVMDALFGFMVILGFFSLAGIIINNGIVLIDQIATEESKMHNRYQALINACVSRLRPIMITTLTTVLGLMPLILANDALFYGMASAMAFGLAVGSIMTLGFVPALYALFYSIKRI